MKHVKHRRKLISALTAVWIMISLSGCEWLPTPSDYVPKSDNEAPADEETSPEDTGFEMPDNTSGQGFKTGSDLPSDKAEEEHELTASELREIEEDFNSTRYNGFLSTEFATAQDIWWEEVFYNGAGIECRTADYAEVERSYLKKTGYEELFGDLDYISTADINDFVLDTTGHTYGSMNHKLDWLYLNDLDVYTHQHGDTNFIPIELSSGIVNDGLYHVYYEAPLGDDVADKRFEVVFDKNDDGYVFISNLWAPECGREEGMEAIYDSLIEKYAKAVDARLDADGLRDENISSFCTIEYNGDEDPMDVIGYYRDDLDGDGIDELLFGANHSEYIMPVYEAYTIKDGSWNRLFMSYDDSVYYLAKDGTFYYQEHIVDEGDRLSHCEMQGAYKFVTAIDMVRVLYDGTYEYSTDYFWKDVQPISEKEYNEYIDDANDMYVNIKYTPLSTVDIGSNGVTALSKGSYTNDELCEMALDYYENETGYRPTISEVDSEDGDLVTIHLYDIVDDHTATSAWYDIDRVTGKGEDGIFGDKVDLTEFAPR